MASTLFWICRIPFALTVCPRYVTSDFTNLHLACLISRCAYPTFASLFQCLQMIPFSVSRHQNDVTLSSPVRILSVVIWKTDGAGLTPYARRRVR